MQGREIGCKTLGYGVLILIVMLCFYSMSTTTQKAARLVKAKQMAKRSQTVLQNLQAVAISVASYEADAKHLPPTESADVFKNALSPKFLSDTSVLVDRNTNKPFTTNPAVSGKKRSAIKMPENVFLLATEPNAKGIRTVLLLSGAVRELDVDDWDALTVARKLPPAPAGKSMRTTSPSPQ